MPFISDRKVQNVLLKGILFEAFAQTRRAFCASFKILRLALPCLQYSVREGHMPWVGALVLNAFEFTVASTSNLPPDRNCTSRFIHKSQTLLPHRIMLSCNHVLHN
jgi:hypothetical protein